MKKKIFTRELKFGLIVIVAIFLLYFGLNFLKGINIFSSTYNYYAKYEEIGGLVESTPVYLRGYKVGQVDEIKYDFTQKEAFVVKISVSKDIPLPVGTVIDLYEDGILGGKAIQLLIPPTNPTREFYKANDLITSTSTPGLLEQLTTNVLPKIDDFSQQADSLIHSIMKILNNESIINTLQSAERTLANLETTSSHLKRMTGYEVPQILGKTDVLLSNLSEVGQNLNKIDYNATFSSLDYTISSLRMVTDKINDDNGTLGALINDRRLYMDLVNMTADADSLIVDLKKNPKRYVHFSLFGRKK